MKWIFVQVYMTTFKRSHLRKKILQFSICSKFVFRLHTFSINLSKRQQTSSKFSGIFLELSSKIHTNGGCSSSKRLNGSKQRWVHVTTAKGFYAYAFRKSKKLVAHGCCHLNQLSTSRVKVINVCFHFFCVVLLFCLLRNLNSSPEDWLPTVINIWKCFPQEFLSSLPFRERNTQT